MLRLITFGGLRVEGGVVVNGAASPRSRLALLAVIAAAGATGVRREKLMAMFWPDSDDERARNALRQALFVLRRDTGGAQLTSGVAELHLDAIVMASDVGDFEQAVKEGRWEDAVACYRGPFLDGVSLRDAPEFERWADEQRQRLGHDYGRVLESLASAATGCGEHDVAAQWWGRRAVLDPLSARVAMAYMQALANAGERERAIQHATVHAAATRAQLELEPDPAVRALADSLVANVEAPGANTTVAPTGDGHLGATRATGAPSTQDPVRSADVDVQWEEGAESPVVEVPPAPADVPRRWRGRRGVVAAIVALLAVSGIAIARPWAAATDPDLAKLDARRVVVADFENLTGDTTFNLLGAALADWVTHGVMLTGVASVVDPGGLAAVRRLTPAVETLSGREGAIAMARAAAAGTVVSGAIYRHGSRLVIRARITDLVNDRVLSSLDPIFAPVADPLQHADLLREKVSGALAAVLDARVASITLPSSRPPTFAAYREYVVGLEQFALSESNSIPYMERASQLDTTFALPLIWAVLAHGNAHNYRARDSVLSILSARRRFLGPLEDLQLQAFQVADGSDDELVLLERGARLNPGSTWSHNAGLSLLARNRLREAIRHFESIDPEHMWVREWSSYWRAYTAALHLSGQYESELRVARRAVALSSSPELGVLETRALLSAGNVRAAREHLEGLLASRDLPCRDFAGLLLLAHEFRVHAHRSDADSVAARWVKLCRDESARRPAVSPVGDSAAWVSDGTAQLSLGLALYIRGEMEEAAPYCVPHTAAVEALLGASERAGDVLRSDAQRFTYEWLHRDMDCDSIREHPGFIALVRPK